MSEQPEETKKAIEPYVMYDVKIDVTVSKQYNYRDHGSAAITISMPGKMLELFIPSDINLKALASMAIDDLLKEEAD